MKSNRLNIFAALLLSGSLTASAQQINLPVLQGGEPAGLLTGTIFDPSRAGIVGANVVVRGEHGTLKLITDEEGKYHAELPAGVYSVEVDAAGFLRSRRAKFRVVAGDNPPFNMMMEPSGRPICVLTVEPVSVKRRGVMRGRRNR